jgi:outer membrane porin, OprD family
MQHIRYPQIRYGSHDMTNALSPQFLGKLSRVTATLTCAAFPLFSSAQSSDISNAPSDLNESTPDNNVMQHREPTPTLVEHPSPSVAQADDMKASSLLEMFTKGNIDLTLRTIYYSGNDVFFNTAKNQDTISYGGQLGFTSAQLYGFSFGISGFLQRPLLRSDNPAHVDTYVGPTITALGEAYLRWQGEGFTVTAGNQQVDYPFAAAYDWRMAPQLFQGISAAYGDKENYVTAFRMYRFKSYVDDSFNQRTLYNESIDASSGVGNQTTSGFWGVGAVHNFNLNPIDLKAQAWYMTYLDYASMAYLQAQATAQNGSWKPFVGVQFFDQTGNGRELLGPIDSQVWGGQFGVKHDSTTLSFGYDYIVPHANSYLNGVLVAPYAHKVAAGPMFAQPFMDSTEDLGAGSAYAVELSGSPSNGLILGMRYSFMDLKTSPSVRSLDQSEYLMYGTYKFSGKLKGFSIANYLGIEYSPTKPKKFIQNRLTLQYQWDSL